MNLTKYRLKQSTLEYQLNIALLINLILMLIMATALCLANLFFNYRNRDRHWYIYEKALPNGNISLASFGSFYLILNSFIPLELPVVIEICKFFSTMFMQNDVHMCQVNKQFREVDNLRVNNMNLHEELANISYIFCDKTGTLT